MKRNFILIITALFFLAATAAASLASGPDGNKRKGKYTYRKVYKSCFERGEMAMKKPFINPSDKTMAQWKRFFDKKDYSEFKCSPEWSELSDAEILDIYSYLYNYAADSPTPAKCK